MSYIVERLAPGEVTAYDLLNTASYVIANWTRTADMTPADDWLALMPEFGMRAEWAGGIERGSSAAVSPFSGIVRFFALTEGMQQYVHSTILNSKPLALVTLLAYDDYTRQREVFTGELVSPHFANSEAAYAPVGHAYLYDNDYLFRAGIKKFISVLGAEAANVLIGTESGGIIGLETQT